MTTRVREIRKVRGMSLACLAITARVSPAWMSFIDKYGHKPQPEMQVRIAAALGATVEELWPSDIAKERSSYPR